MDPSAPGNEPLRELLAECLARMERDGSAALELFLAAHPEHATTLRRRVALLRGAGVVPGPDQPAAAVPERLGPFRLQERLGSGGMGVVYRAEQEPLGRAVALKLIRPEHLYFPGARERFQREVETVARLQHPGIVPVFTVGEEQGIPYFTMALVPGLSLADLLQRLRGIGLLRLSGAHALRVLRACGTVGAEAERMCQGSWVEFAFRVIAQAARALQHAHERGVLHRDIKPHNLMLQPDGQVVLLDFGLATAEGVSRLTRAGAHLGSLPYMAPEQLGGRADAIDVRTDVYALGVTLYELLTLQEAFGGDSEEATRQRIVRGDYAPLLTHNPRLPRDAALLCQTAMQAEPAHRYASAADLARDLQAFLELQPIAAAPPSLWQRTRLAVRRHPAGSLAAVLGFLLLVVAPGAFALQRSWALDLARQQEAAASASVRLALAAVDRMLTRVADHWVADEPRSERVRRELLTEAQGMYEQIRAAHPDDPRIERELAHVALRLGGLQTTLNEFAAAELSLRQGVAVLERLARDPAAQDHRAVLVELASGHVELARIRRQAGQLADAEQLLRRAVDALQACQREAPDDRALAVRALAARGELCVLLHRAGRHSEATAQLDRLLTDVDHARTPAPAPTTLVRLGAEMHRLRGLLAMGRGERAAGVAAFRAGLALLQERADATTDGKELRPELALALQELGAAVTDATEGIDWLQQALALHDALIREFPGRVTLVRGRAECLGQLGDRLLERGQHGEAAAALERALRDDETLLAGAPHLTDYRGALALNQMTLATVRLELGEADAARTLADAAEQHARALVAAAPERAHHHAELARARYTQALVAAARGDRDAEWQAWQDAVRGAAQTMATGPLARHHPTLLQLYVDGAARHAAEHRAADAVATLAEQIAQLPAPAGWCRFHGARLLARAATASARESRAAGVEPTAARALQARALEHLEAAVTDGFADDAALRADPDLGSLRRDPRFAALVARIRR